MAILIDPPMWPAHGTLWSHLISDRSYAELHGFARLLSLPRRGFDLDHYDVPASLHTRAIELGATPVDSREVVRRLRTAGLRVKAATRAAVRPARRAEYLRGEWVRLASLPGLEGAAQNQDEWLELGASLLARWNEPHRRYHDELHLEDVLLALDHLTVRGEDVGAASLLAAWFHDAIYAGVAGSDEADSAALATTSLARIGAAPEITRDVAEIVIATTPEFATREATAGAAHLLDADLSILGAGTSRYLQYTQAVRHEYAHIPEPDFRRGRAMILNRYLALASIYRTNTGRTLWEERARANLAAEISRLELST